ncbi:MAG: DUF305 domain-containing protein [Acidimicrobiales bacterium]
MKRRFALAAVAAAFVLPACGSSGSADRPFNDADVMFAQMMIPHHEQAVEMSDIALDPSVGAGPAVASLAQAIKAAQDPEIEQMKTLLTGWGEPLVMDDGMDHGSMMGGMLSPEELESLGALNGAGFDAAWAKAMIAHHEGAIDMANDVLEDGKNTEIRALADAIISAQQREIEELRPIAG